jgi:polar amino acid transport system substrate-binding protein
MQKIYSLFKLTLLLTCFLQTPIFASIQDIQRRKSIVVCSEIGQIPYEMVDAKGHLYGFDIDTANAFGKYLSMPVEIVNTKWDGIIPALHTNKCDMILSSMVITEERKKSVGFSDPLTEDGVFAMMKKDHAHIKITGNNQKDFDIKGVKIAVQLGTVGDFWSAKHVKNAEIIKYDTATDAFSAIATGRADVFLNEKSYISTMIRMSPGKYHVFNQNLYQENTGAAFRKKDTQLREEFNAFLKKWRESGEYQKVVAQYFN